MRHHFLVHTNFALAFSGAERFQEKYKLAFKDIKKLIQNGIATVNEYAQIFGASYFSGTDGTNYPIHDYKFTLDVLKAIGKRKVN